MIPITTVPTLYMDPILAGMEAAHLAKGTPAEGPAIEAYQALIKDEAKRSGLANGQIFKAAQVLHKQEIRTPDFRAERLARQAQVKVSQNGLSPDPIMGEPILSAFSQDSVLKNSVSLEGPMNSPQAAQKSEAKPAPSTFISFNGVTEQDEAHSPAFEVLPKEEAAQTAPQGERKGPSPLPQVDQDEVNWLTTSRPRTLSGIPVSSTQTYSDEEPVEAESIGYGDDGRANFMTEGVEGNVSNLAGNQNYVNNGPVNGNQGFMGNVNGNGNTININVPAAANKSAGQEPKGQVVAPTLELPDFTHAADHTQHGGAHAIIAQAHRPSHSIKQSIAGQFGGGSIVTSAFRGLKGKVLKRAPKGGPAPTPSAGAGITP